MKISVFTTTISSPLLNWMNDYAVETNRTRRAVLEDALVRYKETEIRERMKADFKRAKKDVEILNLTEWGMDDYHKIVNS